jgi:hypothetical protein
MITATLPEFERLAATGPAYATQPIQDAVDWSSVMRPTDVGEWYLVVFRSVRKAIADEARLTWYDERAHEEAASIPGFVHYFKGPLAEDRSCLSFCLWTSRAAARGASALPHHREAVQLIRESYDRYTLELYRVIKEVGAADVVIEPYERPAPPA